MSGCAPSLHVGDIGIDLIIEFQRLNPTTNCFEPLDLLAEGITTSEILLRDPDGNVDVKVAGFVTDGSDGRIQYTTVAGDLDEPGDWSLQGRVQDAGPTKLFHSEVQPFRVDSVLS